MAGNRLQWQGVQAPNFDSVTRTLDLQNQMFNQATKSAAGALGGYEADQSKLADQAFYQEMMKHNSPEEAQAAMAAGQFGGVNANQVSSQALLNFGKNTDNLQYRSIRGYGHARDVTMDGRADAAYDLDKQAQEVALGIVQGTPYNQDRNAQIAAIKEPAMLAAVNKHMSQFATGNLAGMDRATTGAPSSLGSAPAGAVNTALGNAAGSGAISPIKLSAGISDMVDASEKTYQLPTGLVRSIVMQETGGSEEYVKDPTKYHYEPDASGKRKSTAFGPYGILDSTAKDPGFGVAPLKNKSLAEQTRFATEYLAARIKRMGSVEAGLAAYGEGEEYAKKVLGRLTGGGSGDTKQAATAADFKPATSAAEVTLRQNMLTRSIEQRQASSGALGLDPKVLQTAKGDRSSVAAVAGKMTEAGPFKGTDVNWLMPRIQEVQKISAKQGKTLTAAEAAFVVEASIEAAPDGWGAKALDFVSSPFTSTVSNTNLRVNEDMLEQYTKQVMNGVPEKLQVTDEISAVAKEQLALAAQRVQLAESNLKTAAQRGGISPAIQSDFDQALAAYNTIESQSKTGAPAQAKPVKEDTAGKVEAALAKAAPQATPAVAQALAGSPNPTGVVALMRAKQQDTIKREQAAAQKQMQAQQSFAANVKVLTPQELIRKYPTSAQRANLTTEQMIMLQQAERRLQR